MNNYSNLNGRQLTAIEMNPLTLSLIFSPHGQIDIETYWEFKDPQGRLIDRALSEQFRTSCSLHLIRLHRLLNVDASGSCYTLIFEGPFKLSIFESTKLKPTVTRKYLRAKVYDAGAVERLALNSERKLKKKKDR